MSDMVKRTLEEREKTHGSWSTTSKVIQLIKDVIRRYAPSDIDLQSKEALEMIAHKIGRIICGNPKELDHWLDVAGYATLEHDRLKETIEDSKQ